MWVGDFRGANHLNYLFEILNKFVCGNISDQNFGVKLVNHLIQKKLLIENGNPRWERDFKGANRLIYLFKFSINLYGGIFQVKIWGEIIW